MRLFWERFSNQAQWIKAPALIFVIALTDMKKTCLYQSLQRSGYRSAQWLRGLRCWLRDLLGSRALCARHVVELVLQCLPCSIQNRELLRSDSFACLTVRLQRGLIRDAS